MLMSQCSGGVRRHHGHAAGADILEDALERNAVLGYTEPTTAQLAAAAKTSVVELRRTLAAASALSKVRVRVACQQIVSLTTCSGRSLCGPAQHGRPVVLQSITRANCALGVSCCQDAAQHTLGHRVAHSA